MKRTLFLLLLVLPFSLFAQSGVWASRGISHAFLPHGNFVVDIDGRGVSVYDVSNPATITRVAVAESNSETLDGAFIDDRTLAVLTRAGIDRYALGANGSLALLSEQPLVGYTHIRSDGKWIVASSPSNVVVFVPAEGSIAQQSSIPFMNAAVTNVALSGDTLYVGEGANGLSVIDLTSAATVGFLPNAANDIAVAGKTLVIASGADGLAVADISAPLAPVVVGRTGAGTVNIIQIAAGGGRAFALEGTSTVYEFDISTPAAPQLVTKISEPVQAMAADGTHLFASGTMFDRFGLTTETGQPLRVFDAATMTPVGTFTDLAGPVSGVVTDGSLAYVVDRPHFKVIDISSTAAPREIASLDVPNIQDSLKMMGKQVIIYGRGDVDLVDVSDPYHPRLVKVFQSFGRTPSNAAFARTTILEGNPWSGFHVVDFVNYPFAGQIGGIKGHYYEVVANGGDTAYIAGEAVSLSAIDLSNPKTPTPRSYMYVDVKQALIDDATANHPDLLFVRSGNGVHIYSLAKPLAPAETAFLPMANATLMGAQGDTAYVVDGNAISKVDLSDPAHPIVSGSGLVALSPMQIAVSGSKVVVADRYSLRVFGPETAAPPPPPPPLHQRAARP